MASLPSVPIDQRFTQLIQQFGLTKNAFAMSLGKTASVVQHLIDGRNKPGFDLLCKIFEIYPNVSRDWLLLGRGPMLVSGEHAPKLAPAPLPVEPPLEPIDLSGIEANPARRAGVGVAGSRLQPAEIAATLALAAAVPYASNGHAYVEAPLKETEQAVSPAPFRSTVPLASEAAAAPEASPSSAPAPVLAPSAPAPVVASNPSPDTYLAGVLHAQHLQHQLALAELRNQHLLEQQNMLREMLAMARQAMV